MDSPWGDIGLESINLEGSIATSGVTEGFLAVESQSYLLQFLFVISEDVKHGFHGVK